MYSPDSRRLLLSTGVQVDPAEKQAVVTGSADLAVMAKAVAEAGFKVVN
jgi:hypothetical protein